MEDLIEKINSIKEKKENNTFPLQLRKSSDNNVK